ncbi:peptidoglycan-binding protein [Phytohabitans flavus]|uniref:Peptidoglycan-binding protein n=1 Tax=Phytohabitans flavus TaxID=1076124 RepID=A0A6F8Y2U1_9ACTN|nr:peptidoglycan-binding domain-containing protein [Phytohabitans flavus]BCB80434.1 peptidoglycan-binding protein [Phytohabitans flavus]
MKRGVIFSGVALVAVAAAGVAAVGLGGDRADGTEEQSTQPASTIQVTRQTLVQATTVEGELSHGDPVPLASQAQGTVTWLPAVGATISRGQALLRADERPVVLLYGALPIYRPLASGVEGADVQQFEQNLRELGYTGFTIDDEYTSSTANAVKRWQDDLGVTETGTVDGSLVVVASGAVRVAELTGRVGAPAGGELYTFTGTTRIVTVPVDAGEAGWAVKNAPVTVTLPDGKEVAGKVTAVGTVAASDDSQDGPPGSTSTDGAQIEVTVAVADQRALGSLQQTPVDVAYVAEERTDVLTVPVAALLALAEGGYGLEVVEGGASRYIAVDTGLFADGRVEVSGGGIAEGMTVGLPK